MLSTTAPEFVPPAVSAVRTNTLPLRVKPVPVVTVTPPPAVDDAAVDDDATALLIVRKKEKENVEIQYFEMIALLEIINLESKL